MIEEPLIELILEIISYLLEYKHVAIYAVYAYSAYKAFCTYYDIQDLHPEKLSGTLLERCRSPYELFKFSIFSFAGILEFLYAIQKVGAEDISEPIALFMKVMTVFVLIDFFIYFVALFRTEDEVRSACKWAEFSDILFITPKVIDLVLTYVI